MVYIKKKSIFYVIFLQRVGIVFWSRVASYLLMVVKCVWVWHWDTMPIPSVFTYMKWISYDGQISESKLFCPIHDHKKRVKKPHEFVEKRPRCFFSFSLENAWLRHTLRTVNCLAVGFWFRVNGCVIVQKWTGVMECMAIRPQTGQGLWAVSQPRPHHN